MRGGGQRCLSVRPGCVAGREWTHGGVSPRAPALPVLPARGPGDWRGAALQTDPVLRLCPVPGGRSRRFGPAARRGAARRGTGPLRPSGESALPLALTEPAPLGVGRRVPGGAGSGSVVTLRYRAGGRFPWMPPLLDGVPATGWLRSRMLRGALFDDTADRSAAAMHRWCTKENFQLFGVRQQYL